LTQLVYAIDFAADFLSRLFTKQ